jgi:hypothetical protein
VPIVRPTVASRKQALLIKKLTLYLINRLIRRRHFASFCFFTNQKILARVPKFVIHEVAIEPQHGRPALTRSKWDGGHPNDRRYLGHTALSRPLKKKLLYWIFPASRGGAAGGRRHGVFQQRNTYTGGTDHLSGVLRLNQKYEKLGNHPQRKLGGTTI